MEEFRSLAAKYAEWTAGNVLGIWKGFEIMATENKVQRLVRKIGTHSGMFHCDEALACFMLKLLPEYQESEIIRTREQSVLDTCDIVVDVGGEYNPKTHRYDHHQRGFEHTLSTVRPDLVKNKIIKLSSAGLIYAHFGMEVLSEVLNKHKYTASSECLRAIYVQVYEQFVEELDAIDNGIPMYPEGKPIYKIGTHLSARIHRLNPEWNAVAAQPEDKLFQKAMAMVGSEFIEAVITAGTIWWPAREIVKTAVTKRHEVHPSGELILIERCPWKDHLLDIEEELHIPGKIKFVIFHDKSDTWRTQGVPLQPDSFICREFLHKDWRGVRDEALSSVAGIKGCIFCHSTGFIGGNKTKEGAIEMALKSLSASAINRE